MPDDEIKLKKAPVCIDWSSVDKHKFLIVGERSPWVFTPVDFTSHQKI